jgi:hypothetical protein
LSLKLLDLQCQQVVELTQLLVFFPKKPNPFGVSCGSNHSADRAVDQFADKIVITYPYCSYRS